MANFDLDQEIAQLLDEIISSTEEPKPSSQLPRQRSQSLGSNQVQRQPRTTRPRSGSSPEIPSSQRESASQSGEIPTPLSSSSTTYTRRWLDGTKEFRKPTNNAWPQFIATKTGQPYAGHLLNAAEAATLYFGGGGEYQLKDPVKAQKQREQRRARKARSQL